MLYLVRVNLQKFIGPFDLEGLRKSYRRMEFGLQDEISGDLREWVSFDDFDRIKALYPELASFVKDELLKGWGISEPTRLIQKKRKSDGKLSGVLLWLLILVIGGLGVTIWKRKELSSRVFQYGSADPSPGKALDYFRSKKVTLFQSYIEKYQPEIMRNGNPKDWLPLLRIYAYQKDGRIERLKPRILKGRGASNAPPDCSVSHWVKEFQGNQDVLTEIVQGVEFNSKSDFRILKWDPHWIRRRSPAMDWIQPSSYYEACLSMAAKALEDTSLFPEEEPWVDIRARLAWVLSSVDSSRPKSLPEENGILGAIGCIEHADSLESLENCTMESDVRDWQSLLDRRKIDRSIWILVDRFAHMKRKDLSQLRELVGKVRQIDPSTGMEYGPELRFFQELILNGGRVDAAAEETMARYPGISGFRK